MNAPVPALDERGEFVVATLRNGLTATIFTLDSGHDQYPVCGCVGTIADTWTADGFYAAQAKQPAGSSDIINLDELRATVERARKMRPKFPTRGAHDVAEFYKDEAPARPTFAEALAAEAQQYNSRNVEWTELRSIIERARRASEGP